MYFVYILYSASHGRFYIGQTQNIEKRLLYHNRGKVFSTRSRRPWKLIYFLSFNTRAEAMKKERYLKSLKGGNHFRKMLKEWSIQY